MLNLELRCSALTQMPLLRQRMDQATLGLAQQKIAASLVMNAHYITRLIVETGPISEQKKSIKNYLYQYLDFFLGGGVPETAVPRIFPYIVIHNWYQTQ